MYKDYNENDATLGMEYSTSRDEVKVFAGIGEKNVLQYIRGKYEIIRVPPYTYRQLQTHMINKPKPYQQQCVDAIIKEYIRGNPLAICDLKAGLGKTFTATYLAQTLKTKCLILVKGGSLGIQWFKSFNTHTSMGKTKGVCFVRGTDKLTKLAEQASGVDVLITTHRSLGSLLDNLGVKEFNEWINKFGFGLTVFDEFDTEKKSMFTLASNTNIRYSLFLSATPFLSSKVENNIFQFLFQNVNKFGRQYIEEYEDRRTATQIFYKPRYSQDEYKEIMGREWKFNINRYQANLLKYRDKLPGGMLPELKEAFDTIMPDIKGLLHKGASKTVFFVGRISSCEDMKNILVNHYDIDPNKISILNSETPEKERQQAMENNIIISISKSVGRGIDMDRIQCIVNLETFSSLSILEQMVGRVGRVNAVFDGLFFNLVNMGIHETRQMYNAIRFTVPKLFTDVENKTLYEVPQQSKYSKKIKSKYSNGKSNNYTQNNNNYYGAYKSQPGNYKSNYNSNSKNSFNRQYTPYKANNNKYDNYFK
jgi:superfamily II DNA or RNA helicase